MASTHLLLINRTCSSSSCTASAAILSTRLSRTAGRTLATVATSRSRILASAATTSSSSTTTDLRSSPLQQQPQPSQRLSLQPNEQRRYYTPPKAHFYKNRILDPYVNQTVTPITLRQLVFFGRNMQEDKLLKSANYVRTELPVRLAHRIRDFQNLPFIVGTNPHIEQVYDLYWQAFEKLRQVPEIKTLEANDKFCALVKGLLNDHLVVIPQLALGIMESSKHIERSVVDQFMNKMLRSRISRRVLAEQHISLTANFNSPNHMMTNRGYIGIIYTHCNPREIVERTAHLAAETCRRQQQDFVHSCPATADGSEGDEGEALVKEPPKVILDGSIDAEFAYIPDHIEYILYELLKNSMRFVMLNGTVDPVTGELPPIQITVCEGKEDITFRVSDRGGGIPPAMESHLWSYSQSPITARFANFEKISKMAATVQEQMVSPSRSVNAAENDLGDEETGSGSVKAAAEGAATDSDIEATDEIHNGDILDDELLPPPPPNHKPLVSSHDEAHLLLDRHAEDRMRDRNLGTMAVEATSEPKSSTSTNNSKNTTTTTTSPAQSTPSSSLSTAPSTSSSTVIDPGKNVAPPKKQGHLDRATREAAERQHDQSMHLGIGLPMSRVYAEYWGGDLKVYTMHGYGTDAYARFCKFGNIYENFDV